MTDQTFFDCPNCGQVICGDLRSDGDLRCRRCKITFSSSDALNVRNTPERAEPQGILGRLWNGSSIQLSRREELEQQLVACRRRLGMSQILKSMSATKQEFVEARYRAGERDRLENQVRDILEELKQFEDLSTDNGLTTSVLPTIRVVGRLADALTFSPWTFDGKRQLSSVMTFVGGVGFPVSLSANGLVCRLYGSNSVKLDERRLEFASARPGEKVEAVIRVKDIDRIDHIDISLDDDNGGDQTLDGRGPCKSCGVVFEMRLDSANCPKCGTQMSREEAFFACASHKNSRSLASADAPSEIGLGTLQQHVPAAMQRHGRRTEIMKQIAVLEANRKKIRFGGWYSSKFGKLLNRQPPFDAIPLMKSLPATPYKIVANVLIWYPGLGFIWIPLWYALTRDGTEKSMNAATEDAIRQLESELDREQGR